MNNTIDFTLPAQIIITIEGIFGTIFNIVAITVVFTSQFGSKFTTFVFRAQPIFDLSACFVTTIYYIIQFTKGYDKPTGLYIIDIILCHFWFQNSLFWLPCILSVQNLVCISLDRVSSVIFLRSLKSYTKKFFIIYFVYMVSMVLILYIPTPLLRRYTDNRCVMDFSVQWIDTNAFVEYFVYSWVIFAYCVPVLVMLISHAWVIHTLRGHNSSCHFLSRDMQSNLQIKRRISQLVITTSILSIQQTVLHFFECISQILEVTGIFRYSFDSPIEQMSTLLILLGYMSNPCILVFSTAVLRRRLSLLLKSLTEKITNITIIKLYSN
ncbi:uncharacterized protein DC041_0005273 [Schistosoma bovis]|uniref:G-protein coupled receptors family 1 profile domain-containing protein n=1 Tax=Schistosoma bovis TaxID=6184 RepID=A0A430QSM9_SCHBO|nr:uncharacterized protein DC041_0005273 [Schistosoma bovis]CAH8458625.1 unnamed protein product [Schistosoma bovis]